MSRSCWHGGGGLQILALHQDLVGNGKLSERDFHDAVLRQNSIPIGVLRAAMANDLPQRRLPEWRF